MKKVIAVILSSLIVMVGMAACSSSTSSENKSDNGKKSATIVSNSSKKTEKEESKSSEDAVVKETVLLDESGVKITATKLNYGGIFGPELGLLIENNSGQDLTFQCHTASVNGYMIDAMMSVDIVSGKKANDGIIFTDVDLENSGISTIADMEFAFHIFTSEGWDPYLDTELIQLKTSAADTYQYTFDDSGEVMYEGNGFKIVSKGFDLEGSWLGPTLMVYIENNTNEDIIVQTRDESVNGFMVDAAFSPEVAAGKRIVSPITFLDSLFEENDISKIENVELSFQIFKSSEFDTIVDTGTVTLNF